MGHRRRVCHRCLIIWVFLAVIILLLNACASPHNKRASKESDEPAISAYERVRQIVAQESKKFSDYLASRESSVEQRSTPSVSFEPELPKYNPLDAVIIKSLSVDNGGVQMVLRALAKETGTNLLLHPDLADSKDKVTLSFNQVPATIVFDEIMRITDLQGYIEGNIIRVNPYQEKIFYLDFIETSFEASFDVGGDVLGSSTSSSDGATSSDSLTGKFNITGKGAEETNPYAVVEKMIEQVLTENGKYALNRMSGTLYVKDRPSVIRNIAILMDRLKGVLSRQILIEARILEIQLDDGYQYGIDWALLKKNYITGLGANLSVDATGVLTVDEGFTLPTDTNQKEFGIVISDGDWMSAINMLDNFGEIKIVSNPHIRARHGQPSMISVGRSNTYISKTETSTDTGTTTATQTTTIETDQVFDGLLLGVIPFIADRDNITLSIHPIKSDVDSDSLELIELQNSSVSLPRVDLKEISTTINLQDGDTIVLGGLIDRRQSKNRSGTPFLSKVPVLSWLFKNETYHEMVREFVIVMKVSVI